jgi:hypothetical protein
MKKQILTSSFIALLLFLSSSAQTHAALDPLPAPSAPHDFSDKYSTDLFTGSAL